MDGGAGSFNGRVTARFAHGSLVLGGGNESGTVSQWLAVGVGAAENADGIGGRSTADARLGLSVRFPFAAILSSAGMASSGHATYADGTIHAEWTPFDRVSAPDARLGMAVDAGDRVVQGGALAGPRRWLSGSVSVKMLRALFLVSRAGYEPADPIRGTPGATSVSVSLRVVAGRGSRAGSLNLVRSPTGTMVSRPLSEGRRLITMSIRAATSVELMGDFTGWRPVRMTPDSDGRWKLIALVAPGSHRVNVRVNGGAWGVPPDLPAQDDDFDGRVGILLVP